MSRQTGGTRPTGLSFGGEQGIVAGASRRRSDPVEAIRRERQDLRLSYRDLAAAAGLSFPRVYRTLSGRSRPRSREIARLRQAMSDMARRLRSSEPEFLRQIQQVAVPFLRRSGELRMGAQRGADLQSAMAECNSAPQREAI